MKRLLGALIALGLTVGLLRAQSYDVWAAPSIAREDVPVKIHSSSTMDVKVLIFDKFGNLVFEKNTTLQPDQPLEWEGVTNGGRKVDSGQYRLIVLIKDPNTGEYRPASTNVEWIAVYR